MDICDDRRVGFVQCAGAFFLLLPLAISNPASGLHPAQSSESARKILDLVQQGNSGIAQQLLTEALKKSPADATLYNLQGVVKAQSRDFAGSEASFRKAIELAPGFADAYLNLGHLYQEWMSQRKTERDKAITVYAELLKLDPANVEANYQSAFLLMQKGLYTPSLRHLSRLPSSAKGSAQALSVLCGDYAGSGEKAKADEAGERMSRSPDLQEADVLSIVALLTQYQNSALAVRLLEGLQQRNLATAHSLTELGLLYKQDTRLDDARQTLEQAAQLIPPSVPLLIDLARVANDQKDYKGALGYLAHARELEPQNASIQFFWGLVCVQMNLAEEAFQALKKAVSLDPNNAYYNYALGAVALGREQGGEAIPYFRKYCQLKPDDPRGRLALGSAYFASHDDGSAERIILTVQNDADTAAGAHYYLGRIANQRGNYPEALAQLTMALKSHPNYADAYAERGLIHLKQKDYAGAAEDLRRALEIKPDSYPANLNLLILYQRTKDPKTDEQAKRFEQVRQEAAERAKEYLRTIDVRP